VAVPRFLRRLPRARRRAAPRGRARRDQSVIPARRLVAASQSRPPLSIRFRTPRDHVPRGHRFVGTVKKLWDYGAKAAIFSRVGRAREDTSQSAISIDPERPLINRVTSLRFGVVPRENRARGHVRDITPGSEFLAFRPFPPCPSVVRAKLRCWEERKINVTDCASRVCEEDHRGSSS